MTMIAGFDKDTFRQPRQWRLALLVSPSTVTAAAWRITGDPAMVWGRVEADAVAVQPVRRIEEVVYATPALLSEFDRVTCLIDTPHVLPVPTVDAQAIEAMGRGLWGDADAVLADVPDEGAGGVSLVYAFDRPLEGFLRRSLCNPTLHHRLTPLIACLGRRSRLGNKCRAFVNLRHDSLDVVVTGRSGVTLVNTFEFAPGNADDAAYHVLAACRGAGFAFDADDLMLCGNGEMRQAITPVLMRFVATVLPVIFPSEVIRAAGREATEIPYELISTMVCE